MRAYLTSAAALAMLVAACSPPSATNAPSTPTPVVVACNATAPNAALQVAVQEETAVAAAASDLRGGAITPGVYDLVRAMRIGAATGWDGTRAVALEVAESAEGAVSFNWAGAAPNGEVDRWTAAFAETPQPSLTYSCGRIGAVAAAFAATERTLQLQLQDGAGGQLALSFERRG